MSVLCGKAHLFIVQHLRSYLLCSSKIGDDKSVCNSEAVGRELSAHIGGGSDDSGISKSIRKHLRKSIGTADMSRKHGDNETSAVVHDNDSRIVRLGTQQRGNCPHCNTAGTDENKSVGALEKSPHHASHIPEHRRIIIGVLVETVAADLVFTAKKFSSPFRELSALFRNGKNRYIHLASAFLNSVSKFLS